MAALATSVSRCPVQEENTRLGTGSGGGSGTSLSGPVEGLCSLLLTLEENTKSVPHGRTERTPAGSFVVKVNGTDAPVRELTFVPTSRAGDGAGLSRALGKRSKTFGQGISWLEVGLR
jgi:hypothetical protein